MGNFKHIFTPIRIGRLTVKNRIETAPAMPFLANVTGDVSQELMEWQKTLARGGAGIVTVGDTSVFYKPNPMVAHKIYLDSDRIINSLNRLAETIQRYGAKASIELTSKVPPSVESITDLTLDDINTIIESYASAAYRCMVAGMDMIMVHGAHGQFISQFLSQRINKRADKYGGSFKNRARLVMEILEAIRNKVGDRLAIEYRISADEFISDGFSLDEQIEFAVYIQDKIDLIHVSAGHLFRPESIAMMIQPTYVPKGVNVHFAEAFKNELNIPVTTVGSIDLEMAEQIIAENRADIVALNRVLLADPDGVNKAKKGKAETIRPCIRCNTCIDRTHKFFLSIRCAVNPLNGREAEFVNQPTPARKKKVVVVGGGPAGMEAARRAADRGHEVVLFEKDDHLGGALTMASAPSFKADMKAYLDWAIRITLNTPGLTVHLSKEATPELVRAENPDALIIAVGSAPAIPDIPGIDRTNVVWAGDVDLGNARVGDNVVIAGAGLTGSETALNLAQQGKKVVIIDILTLDEIDKRSPAINIGKLRSMLMELDVDTKEEVQLDAVTESGVLAKDKNGNEVEIVCDTVVLALGLIPRLEVVNILQETLPDVYVVGDCNNEEGNLYKAISEGFFAAMDI
jgi:2,4-dienoyl-CoA reductase-like NADH-dependent reductase (Old Yellow Enzyme family)/thioredoxin reductase